MRDRVVSGGISFLFIAVGVLQRNPAEGQTIRKEYVRMNGRVVAMETNILPPQLAVSPGPASGSVISFTSEVVSGSGAADVMSAEMLVNSTLSGVNACHLQVELGSSTITLFDDDGFGQQSAALPFTGLLQNSQCLVSNVPVPTLSGNKVLWYATVTLKAAFISTGTKTIYEVAYTGQGGPEWTSLTTWSQFGAAPVLSGAKPGIFRSGYFWILDLNGSGAFEGTGVGQDAAFAFGGIAGDKPLSGDWNGNGHWKVGVYREQGGNSSFILDYDGDRQVTGFDKVYVNYAGVPVSGQIPVTGDWNGDGRADIGVFRSGQWILDWNGNGVYDAPDKVYNYGGLSGDVPMVGDWNGDGKSKVGIFRSGFLWLLDNNGDGAYLDPPDSTFGFGGISGDLPLSGDWAGLGKTAVGVFRRDNSSNPPSPNFFWVLDYDANHIFEGAPTPDRAFAFGGIALDVAVPGRW